MVKPSKRKEMAQHYVASKGITIKLACQAFRISEMCYRYEAKLSDENQEIAQMLIDLTNDEKDWGFGLCFDYLRNVKGKKWNHKRVYRIYTELALNLRVKQGKSMKGQKIPCKTFSA